MKMTFMCSQTDIDFIEQVYREFGGSCAIEETQVSGITGYEVVMLVVEGVGLVIGTLIPFIKTHMTHSDNGGNCTKRCIIDKNNRIGSFEGFSMDEIVKAVNEIGL